MQGSQLGEDMRTKQLHYTVHTARTVHRCEKIGLSSDSQEPFMAHAFRNPLIAKILACILSYAHLFKHSFIYATCVALYILHAQFYICNMRSFIYMTQLYICDMRSFICLTCVALCMRRAQLYIHDMRSFIYMTCVALYIRPAQLYIYDMLQLYLCDMRSLIQLHKPRTS